MIKISDILIATVKEVSKCVDAQHYVMSLPEGYLSPSLLYLVTFNKNSRYTKFVQKKIVNIQIICFMKNAYENATYGEKFELIDKLSAFLDRFYIKINDRTLKFTYNYGDADGQLTIDLDFTFYDEALVEDIEEGARELIETIYVNKERMT
ncbi:MAG: hypothetical protein BEN18_10290 [Epulopiscium sp. Nuni2H_MBin001]|nr:MAG: hypothetical protein BEN18_10290 [Epulopiscium sp. Nuni2H_MBin001]